MVGAWIKDTLPVFLTAFEKRLAKNSSPHYWAGDKLSIADFAWFAVTFGVFHNELNPLSPVLKPIYDSFPHLKAYSEHQKEELKEYLESRPKREF